MRRLNKGQPLPIFTNCVQNDKPANWDDFSRNFKGVSQETRLHILCEEQNSLCGYTELPISNPYNCHIDHYKKKGIQEFQSLTFDWDNFIVASMDDDFGARYKDLTYSIKAHEYSQIINPVLMNAQHYFYYPDYDLGDILPKPGLSDVEKAMAERTIEVFNLGHRTLKNRRESIIRLIESYGDLPSADIRDCLKDSGFKSLVEQYTQGR